jgi:hypothetical protein
MKMLALYSFLLALSSTALADSDINLDPSVYTEISVPCSGRVPNFNQPVGINQRDLPHGGERRIVPTSGESYFARGSDLVCVNASGSTFVVLGHLQDTPTCYQTDPGGEFYSTWTPVQIRDNSLLSFRGCSGK